MPPKGKNGYQDLMGIRAGDICTAILLTFDFMVLLFLCLVFVFLLLSQFKSSPLFSHFFYLILSFVQSLIMCFQMVLQHLSLHDLLLCFLMDKLIGFLVFQFQISRRENLLFGFQFCSSKLEAIDVEGDTGSHGEKWYSWGSSQ